MPNPLQTFIAALAALLAGCSASYYSPQRASGPQPTEIFGSALVVTQPVTIPGNTSHITFANGAQGEKFERFTPFCDFEVNSLSREPRTVLPGRYPIADIRNRMASDENTGFMDVGLSFHENMFGITTIRLRDPAGEVHALTCKKEFPSSVYVRFPSRQQINAILGPPMHLE